MNPFRRHIIRVASSVVGLSLLLWMSGEIGFSSSSSRKVERQPRLVVLIVVDQMRADYLDRFREQFTGGFKTLLEEGAVFTNAHQDHALTQTAPGHASLLSGRYPRSTGIISNAWFDRHERRSVESIEDAHHPQLDDLRRGVSPVRFHGTTLVDWLLQKYKKAQALSVSRKDRAAVLMVGKRAEHVYWYSATTGGFTTSAYYRPDLPRWVRAFNARHVLRKYVGRRWELLLDPDQYRASREDDFPNEANPRRFGRSFPHPLPEDEQQLRRLITLTPWMDAYVLQFARTAITELHLGVDEVPDVLAISLSSTDAIGHAFGPYSKEIHDHLLRLDRWLGDFFRFLDKAVGRRHTLIVLTADHGVAPLPEFAARRGRKARRFSLKAAVKVFRDRLVARWGPGRWILHYRYGMLYFDRRALSQKGVHLVDLEREAADYFRKLEPVARVYEREYLRRASVAADPIERRVIHSFHPRRSGDVWLVFKPYYLESVNPWGTSHGSPYDYDTHVPLIFLGAGVRSGRYGDFAATVDIAPTLADILGLHPAEPLDGHSRKEILNRRR
ncbi:MAG: alkaline phosphatase family protein [Acidobacteria bacterium]|nr:MAG: alkaline phosphatase family protein [Acidobacteriota bacterium]